MLNEQDILWLVDIAKSAAAGARPLPVDVPADEVKERLKKIMQKLEEPVLPLELLIICPRCLKQHVDEGEFATKAHRNHSCQFCGLTFQASGPVKSIGVQFFRGYKNGVVFIPGKSSPSISLPTLSNGAQIWYTGQKVRFKKDTGHLGFDLEKVFKIAAIGPSGSVLLEGEDDMLSTSLIEPVP